MFLQFYYRLMEAEAPDEDPRLLSDGLELVREELGSLQGHRRLLPLRQRHGSMPESALEQLWQWYALSRLADLLLLHLHPERPAGQRDAWLPAYRDFFGQAGFEISEEADFHPFHHEIVKVTVAEDPEAQPRILQRYWPGFLFGEMLFVREGVHILAGENRIVKPLAENSRLYFTFRREGRPVRDLSHGWGSNSQWRTCFRRDYRTPEAFHYNLDETEDLYPGMSLDEYGLDFSERVELLTYRCWVRTRKPDQEFWPFDDRYTEPRAKAIDRSFSGLLD